MKSTATKQSTMLVTAKELAEMLSVSTRHIWRLKAMAKLPKAIEIGHCVRWKLVDISDWLAMGCPKMTTFEAKKQA